MHLLIIHVLAIRTCMSKCLQCVPANNKLICMNWSNTIHINSIYSIYSIHGQKWDPKWDLVCHIYIDDVCTHEDNVMQWSALWGCWRHLYGLLGLIYVYKICLTIFECSYLLFTLYRKLLCLLHFQRMGAKVVLLLISVLCCTLLPFARSSEDEVVSSVHLEDTWRTLTEADLRTELHLPRDSKLQYSCPF